jgi:hypothetical protein
MAWVEKGYRFYGFIEIFLLSTINGFEKPHERGLVRSVVLFTTILDNAEGNDRPMCKLGVRVNLQHIY